MKIIVIGAGIGGLAAAIALRKVGLDVHVYERAPELREVGAGIGLAGNAVRALDCLGLGGAIRSERFAAVPGSIRNPQGKALATIPADELTGLPGGVTVLHRAELLALLLQHVEAERLHLGQECVGFNQDKNGVTALFRNGETAYGHLLIGADGLNSQVRTQLFGDLPIRYAGYTAWRAVVDLPRGHNLIRGETWGRGRRFGIVPMSRGRIYWFATNNSPEGARVAKGQSKPILSELFRGWHEPIEALIEAASENSILRNDIYDMDPLPHWVRDRVALLGDAAHPMTPNLGQGACQAIEDAVVLAACLRGNESVDAALIAYQRRRIPRATQCVRQSRWLGILAQSENPVLCWLSNAAMKVIPTRLAARRMQSLTDFEILSESEKSLFQSEARAFPGC